MSKTLSPSLVVFIVEGQRFALSTAVVQRVHRSVEIVPLPGAPDGVRGVVNVQGAVLPVFDLRLQLGLPERSVRLTDYVIIAETSRRTVALLVDAVAGVIAGEGLLATRAEEIGVQAPVEILKIKDDLVLVHDLDRFLSEQELEALQLALAERT